MDIAEQQKPPPGELYLDHVSHFVQDLDAAARLFEALGFAMTAASAQRTPQGPVGASNRCAMLEAGYIEILAPRPDTGLRLCCFGTPDAEAEHRRLADHGFAPQPLVDLSRRVEGGRTVRFKVARPAADAMPEGRIQYVQHLAPEVIWTAPHLRHANGVRGLAAVYVSAPDPAETAARWARFSALLPTREGEFVRLDTARGSVYVGPGPGPALAGYALACDDPGAFAARCRKAGLAVRRRWVTLPPALGGGWFLVPARSARTPRA